MKRDLMTMLTTTFVAWMGQRLTGVALPLVALEQTGSAWTAGLVGGAVGLPMLTSAWWARRLRQWLTTGRALAIVVAVQVAGVLIVPVTVWWGHLTAAHLVASGVVMGVATTLSSPAQQALVADLSGTPERATKMLAWKDFMHRITMMIAPPLAGWAVAYGQTHTLLWAEAIALTLVALMLLTVRGDASSQLDRRPEKLREVLARYPMIRRVVIIETVGGLAWFAFPLGLALLSVEVGRPGVLVGAGWAGYGIGTVLGALLAPSLSPKLPPLATAAIGWLSLGVSFTVLPLFAHDLVWLGIVAGLGGFSMPLAISALNRLITTQTRGADRRAAFAAHSYLHEGGTSLGLLTGGAIIGLAGAGTTMVLAGLAVAVVAVAAGPWWRRTTGRNRAQLLMAGEPST